MTLGNSSAIRFAVRKAASARLASARAGMRWIEIGRVPIAQDVDLSLQGLCWTDETGQARPLAGDVAG